MSAETTTPRRSSFTLLEGLVLLLVLGGLVSLITWGVQRTKRQAERSHAKKVLREAEFILVLDQKDHVARSDNQAGSRFVRPMIQSPGRPLNRGLLEDIALVDEVQTLSLRNSFIRDEDLKTLAPLTQLRELDVSGSLITDDGLEALTAFPNLEELDISLTKVRGPGLRHLKPLKKLRTLRVASNEIPDSAMPYIEMLSQLKWIDVAETWLSDESKEKLGSIRISESNGQQMRLIDLQQVLSASGEFHQAGETRSAISMLSASWPRKLKAIIPPDGQITRLSLRNADLRLPRFESVRGGQYRLRFPHLQYLNLSHTRFDAERSPEFAAMDDLRELNIVASDCGDLAFGRLRSCGRLRTLDARLCGLSDNSMRVVGSLKHLETLRLGQNLITDAQLKELLHLTKLERLELDSCDITDKGLAVLARLPGLRHLSLSRTYVTRDGVAKLHNARPEVEVRLTGVDAVAATDELVGQFNRTREAPVIAGLKKSGMQFHVEGSYGRVISVAFSDSYQITDEDMKWIGRLTGLRKIQGDKPSQISAKGVRELAELTELKYLDLKSPRLENSTLGELLRFRALDRAYLYSTSITEYALAGFLMENPRHDAGWNSEYVRILFNYHADR